MSFRVCLVLTSWSHIMLGSCLNVRRYGYVWDNFMIILLPHSYVLVDGESLGRCRRDPLDFSFPSATRGPYVCTMSLFLLILLLLNT